jgi:Na+/proline symporter
MLQFFFRIDHIMVGIFLLVTLFLGIRASRRIKDIREYALANRIFGTGALTMTMAATYLGGNIIGTQKNILKYGLIAGIGFLGTVINFFWISKYIVPKLSRFKNSFTLGDVVEEMYGPYSGILAAVLGTAFSIFRLGGLLVAVGHICSLFLGWSVGFSIVFIGCVLTLYSALGGVRSITITDIMHFIIFMLVIPMMATAAVSKAGGLFNIFKQLPALKLEVFNHSKFENYFSKFLVWSILPGIIVNPAIIQRVLMARYSNQASTMFSTTAFIILFVRVLVVITCLAVLSINPGIKPSSAGAYLYIVNNYFPYWLKIISILGMLSLVMSSVDSVLNAGAVLLTHNILKPFYLRKGKQINELSVVKYVSVILGVFAIFMASLNIKEVRTLTNLSVSLVGPSLVAPFIMGALGFRTNQITFITSTLITALSFVLISLFTDFTQDFAHQPIMYGFGFVSFITVHAALHGWNFTFDKIQHVPATGIDKEEDFSKYGINYVRLGIFICALYLMPHFISDFKVFSMVLVLRVIGIILCVGLLMRPYWKPRWQVYFPVYWKLMLFYCLPFMFTVFYLLNNSSKDWSLAVSVSMMLLVVALDWKNFIFISAVGIILGYVFVKYILGQPIPTDFTRYMYLLEFTFSCTLIAYLFLKSKDYKIDEAEEDNRKLYEAKYSLETRLFDVQTKKQKQDSIFEEEVQLTGELQKFQQDVDNLLENGYDQTISLVHSKVNAMVSYLREVSAQVDKYMKLDIDSINIVELLKNSIKASALPEHIEIFESIDTNISELIADSEKLKKVIGNSIKLIHELYPESTLNFFVENTELGYELKDLQKYVKKIPALRIVITTKYSSGELEKIYMGDAYRPLHVNPDNIVDLYRIENQEIIHAHYGIYNHMADTIEFVIPVNIKDIRPNKLDSDSMDDIIEPVYGSAPSAEALENFFIQKVKSLANEIDINELKRAIAFSKKYHQNKTKLNGEPVYFHSIRVAEILLDYTKDQNAIVAALLHDLVDETRVSIKQISALFNDAVGDIVNDVSRVGKGNVFITSQDRHLKLERLTNKLSVCLAISDRIDHMRYIHDNPSLDKRKELIKETLSFYYLFASKQGMFKAMEELAKLAFYAMQNIMVLEIRDIGEINSDSRAYSPLYHNLKNLDIDGANQEEDKQVIDGWS